MMRVLIALLGSIFIPYLKAEYLCLIWTFLFVIQILSDILLLQKQILNIFNTILMDISIFIMGLMETIDEFNGFSKNQSSYAGKIIVYLFLAVQYIVMLVSLI